MEEHFFQCPYCWETISMLLDTSLVKTAYVEDCEVCCHPIQISYSFQQNTITSFSAQSLEDDF